MAVLKSKSPSLVYGLEQAQFRKIRNGDDLMGGQLRLEQEREVGRKRRVIQSMVLDNKGFSSVMSYANELQ